MTLLPVEDEQGGGRLSRWRPLSIPACAVHGRRTTTAGMQCDAMRCDAMLLAGEDQ